MKQVRPVLLLGVDAADPDLIRQWALEGELPYFRELEQQAAVYEVENDVGFFVGSVWPSFATGVTPDQHRWYCYSQYSAENYKDKPFNPSTMLSAEPFWGHLSRNGTQIGVFDVPLIPIVPGLNGFQVSEWGSHDTFLGGIETWPKPLARRILTKYGDDPSGSCDEIGRTPEGYEAFLSNLRQRITTREHILSDLCNEYSPDFLFTVLSESHCVGHQLWHQHDSGHPRFDAHTAARLGDPLLGTYQALDETIRRLTGILGDAHILVLLSHGMGPHYGIAYMLNSVLQKLDGCPVPTFEKRWSSVQKAWQATPAWLKKILPNMQPLRLELKMTLAARGRSKQRFFAVTNNDVFGAVRVNKVGREPRGLVSHDEYPVILEWLAEQLLALRCAQSGEPVVLDVVRTADVYDGAYLDELPDLLLKWNQSLPIHAVKFPDGSILEVPYEGARSGDHRGDALGRLYHLGGEHSGDQGSIRNIDLATTISAMLGAPNDVLPGRVVSGIAVGQMPGEGIQRQSGGG